MQDTHDSRGFDVAAARNRSSSPWRKGCLLGLLLTSGCVWMIATAATPECTFDTLGEAGFLSLHVGGFSLFVTWTTYGCR